MNGGKPGHPDLARLLGLQPGDGVILEGEPQCPAGERLELPPVIPLHTNHGICPLMITARIGLLNSLYTAGVPANSPLDERIRESFQKRVDWILDNGVGECPGQEHCAYEPCKLARAQRRKMED